MSECKKKSGSNFWEVVIPAPLFHSFTYEIPADFPSTKPGMRVLVPFGNSLVTGFLLKPQKSNANFNFKLRKAIMLLDKTPSLGKELLNFLLSAASYYMYPVGEVFKTAMPPGALSKSKNPVTDEKTEKFVTVTTHKKNLDEKTIIRAPVRAAVFSRIVQRDEISFAELKRDFKNIYSIINKLTSLNLVKVVKRKIPDELFAKSKVPKDKKIVLTPEQNQAVSRIGDCLDNSEYKGFLLNGITGSGKTEVYFQIIKKVNKKGLGTLVLVPEIALTPQLVGRYRARFGENIAVLHSGLSDRKRYSQWQKLRDGKVNVAIGVRSAIFAPVKNLGLIVVDEEHDGSFKQETRFPYSARDMALLRASMCKAVAVLGSATPSLESHYNAGINKLYELKLTKRATSQALPQVEIINLKYHKSGPMGQNVISKPLFDALRETLKNNEQAILFLNRRGYSPCLICSSCGHTVKCPNCMISMTLHKHPPIITCHYCNERKPIPAVCPDCKNDTLKPLGLGTQKVLDTVSELFPDARVKRLDRDVAGTKGAESVLSELRERQVDILVGTQMVTKGHDFPYVTFVGVLLADIGLHMPDFRASERTFGLITQVAGRAGRMNLKGRVIIQTYVPDHPAIAMAQNHDFYGFANIEMKMRQELGYPPYGRLAALKISGKNFNNVRSFAFDLKNGLVREWERTGRPDVTILGPSPAPLSFLNNRHRFHMLLKSKRQDNIRALLTPLRDNLLKGARGVRCNLIIDPVSMM